MAWKPLRLCVNGSSEQTPADQALFLNYLLQIDCECLSVVPKAQLCVATTTG